MTDQDAQDEYDNDPELQELLKRATESGTINKIRQARLHPEEGGPRPRRKER